MIGLEEIAYFASNDKALESVPEGSRVTTDLLEAWRKGRYVYELQVSMRNAQSFDTYTWKTREPVPARLLSQSELSRRTIKVAHEGTIAVDFDRTLAHMTEWEGHDVTGPPIKKMVDRIRSLLRAGRKVVIFTARMADHGKVKDGKKIDAKGPIEAWCKKHLGTVLPVTNEKTPDISEIYDDIAHSVEPNIGRVKM